MIWTDSELMLRFEGIIGQVPAESRQLYGNFAPLLAARMNERRMQQRPERCARGTFEDYLHHTKFVHACLMLESHRCLSEVMDWAYRSAVARGEDTEALRGELEGWLQVVGRELDGMSWAWLNDTYPGLAGAVEKAVDAGARPEELRRLVITRTGRMELALRVEQAARALG